MGWRSTASSVRERVPCCARRSRWRREPVSRWPGGRVGSARCSASCARSASVRARSTGASVLGRRPRFDASSTLAGSRSTASSAPTPRAGWRGRTRRRPAWEQAVAAASEDDAGTDRAPADGDDATAGASAAADRCDSGQEARWVARRAGSGRDRGGGRVDRDRRPVAGGRRRQLAPATSAPDRAGESGRDGDEAGRAASRPTRTRAATPAPGRGAPRRGERPARACRAGRSGGRHVPRALEPPGCGRWAT